MPTKTLIFSDTHLTHRADPEKLAFLLRIITEADEVVINGDFWDSHLTNAKKFFQSPSWQPLFQLLKKKRGVYIYGNHDSKEACLGYESIFSNQQFHEYILNENSSAFHIEHGNRIAPDLDETNPHIPTFILSIGTLLDGWATRLFGKRFLAHYKKWNEKMKRRQKKHLDTSLYLITGHSHYAELSPKVRFANSGSIRGGLASYLILENSHLQLIKTKY